LVLSGKKDGFVTAFGKLTTAVEETFGDGTGTSTYTSSNGSSPTAKKKGFFARLFGR
jgi:hypothetical protein